MMQLDVAFERCDIHQAACWFRQAEIQFALHGVTSDTTKFYHVFASIDQNAAQHLMDIIAKPPEVSCPKRQEKNGFLKFCAESSSRSAKTEKTRPIRRLLRLKQA